jgi:enterochelin esterase-like enzyme
MSGRLRVGLLALACALALGACSSGSGETAHGTTTTRRTATTPEKTVPTLPARLDNGANGLPQVYPPGHMAPTRACGDRVRATPKSLVTRVLPDGPRRPDGSLAFTSGVCVYLPPGYVASGLRYPVLYLLHGGGGDEADAVTFGHIRQLMDDRIAQDPANAMIVVMPDGDTGHWYDSINGSFQIERYVIDSVVPYVDQNFRTINRRTARAIDGVSNGGLGAMALAAKHPALFGVAGGMSSNLDALTLPGLGDRNGSYFRKNHPIDLIAGLDHTPIILDVASRCTSKVPADLCISQRVDQAFLPANRAFVAALRARPQRHAVLDYREIDGAHQWIWWNRTLRDRHLEFIAAHLTDPERSG